MEDGQLGCSNYRFATFVRTLNCADATCCLGSYKKTKLIMSGRLSEASGNQSGRVEKVSGFDVSAREFPQVQPEHEGIPRAGSGSGGLELWCRVPGPADDRAEHRPRGEPERGG